MPDALQRHLRRLARLDRLRATHASGGKNSTLPSCFLRTEDGSHYYIFPALPSELPPEVQVSLLKTWIENEWVTSPGMVAELNAYSGGPIVVCPTRRIGPDGFEDEVVKEWGEPEFLTRQQKSLEKAVNDALERHGHLASYKV